MQSVDGDWVLVSAGKRTKGFHFTWHFSKMESAVSFRGQKRISAEVSVGNFFFFFN